MAGEKGSVFEGKTLDDAVRMGLDALGLSRAEVMITVLEEGSGGFLGLGARPYKVRVMPRPGGAPREPGERGDRDQRPRGGRGRRERGGGEGRGEPARVGRREGRPGDRDRGGSRGPRVATHEGATPKPEPATNGEGSMRRRRGRRGGRSRGGDRPAPAAAGMGMMPPEPSGPPPRRAAQPEEMRPPREPRSPIGPDERPRPGLGRPPAATLSEADLEARATQATGDLLRAMGFEARLTARAEGDNVDVTAEVSEGEDLLVGRKGEVRQALQHLLNLTVNRGEGIRYHLQLEINDFWQRREIELRTLAQSMADEALARGGEVMTDYLNAQERRVIHVSLREDTRVKTYAIGDGLIKKLAVAPADQQEASRTED
jgi:spoIIIJ-associated protein